MAEPSLRGHQILVVEDEYFLADELRTALRREDAIVLGPFANVPDALAYIAEGGQIDGAVLDVNLNGEMAFPVADALRDRKVPFLFVTGYDASVIPHRFDDISRCGKPAAMENIRAALSGAVQE